MPAPWTQIDGSAWLPDVGAASVPLDWVAAVPAYVSWPTACSGASKLLSEGAVTLSLGAYMRDTLALALQTGGQ